LLHLFADLAVELIESIAATENVKPELGRAAIRYVPNTNFTSFYRQWEMLLRDEAC
jgi:hypothetical protein